MNSWWGCSLCIFECVSSKEDSSVMNKNHFTTDRCYLKCALLLHLTIFMLWFYKQKNELEFVRLWQASSEGPACGPGTSCESGNGERGCDPQAGTHGTCADLGFSHQGQVKRPSRGKQEQWVSRRRAEVRPQQALKSSLSPGVPGDELRGPGQRVSLREDGLARLRWPWRACVRGGQDGRAYGGQRAQTQRRRHRGHSTGCGAHEVRLQRKVGMLCGLYSSPQATLFILKLQKIA